MEEENLRQELFKLGTEIAILERNHHIELDEKEQQLIILKSRYATIKKKMANHLIEEREKENDQYQRR